MGIGMHPDAIGAPRKREASVMCRYGDACERADCIFKHSDKRQIPQYSLPSDGSNVLFIGKLPKQRPLVTEEDIQAYFEQFGKVLSVRIKQDEFGRNRGFGFVVFTEAYAADAAVAQGHPEW